MEDRIKRMESAIRISNPLGVEERLEAKEEETNFSDIIESQAELSNHFADLVIDSDGSPNFIGT